MGVEWEATYADLGVEFIVLADSLPSMDLTRENSELFFAGWDGDWGMDPAGWIRTWGNGIAPTGAMVVETETMEITYISAGDLSTAAAIEAALDM